MNMFKITTIHINALVAILLLTAIAITVLVVEAANQVVGCALGEVMLVCIGGIVWCAKAFAAQGGAGNGDAE